jgi:hypothetical protein
MTLFFSRTPARACAARRWWPKLWPRRAAARWMAASPRRRQLSDRRCHPPSSPPRWPRRDGSRSGSPRPSAPPSACWKVHHAWRRGRALPAQAARGFTSSRSLLDAFSDRALASPQRTGSQPRRLLAATPSGARPPPSPPTRPFTPPAGALLVSEYTDTVDVPSWRMNKSGRIINSLQVRNDSSRRPPV